MNYRRIYESLIFKAQNRAIVVNTYYEKHHILPKCLGGSDTSDNLVFLYPEEHYLAHQLLVKLHPTEPKLVTAAVMMTVDSNGHRSRNKLYGWLRRKHQHTMSVQQNGDKNTQYGTRWITDGTKSKKIKTDEDIPTGWKIGRVMQRIRKKYYCSVCGDQVETRRQKYCLDHRKEKAVLNAKTHFKSSTETYDGKFFITDGINDKLHPKNDPIPSGFQRGRSNNKHKLKKI